MLRTFLRYSHPLLVVVLAVLVCFPCPSALAQQTFSNSAAIAIVDDAAAQPYPSTINVSGVNGPVQSVTVSLTGFHHTWPADVNALLVGPGGQNVVLMANCGAGNSVSGVNLTFDDTATAFLPSATNITSGSYRTTNNASSLSFPLPAPSQPWGTGLSVFRNMPSNGTWQLYVNDDSVGDSGAISGGWSLHISACQPSPGGQLSFETQPVGGTVNSSFPTQPVVAVLNTCGSVNTTFGGAVTLALQSGSGSAGAVLQGQTTVNAINGVATFTNVSVDRPGYGYGLLATASGLSSAKSASFDVSAPIPPGVLCVRLGGTGNGLTWSTAFGTIESAVIAATAGQQIWVAEGTYKEHVSTSTPLTLLGGFTGTESLATQRSATLHPTVISAPEQLNFDGSTVLIDNQTALATTVDGFTITGGTGYQSQSHGGSQTYVTGGGVLVDSGNAIITHNHITGNRAYGSGVPYGSGVMSFSNLVLSDNEIDNNTLAPAVAIFGPSNVVTRNYIHDNSGAVQTAFFGSPGGVISDNLIHSNTVSSPVELNSPSGGLLFSNNTVVGNASAGSVAVTATGSVALYNNIIAFNTGLAAVSLGAGVEAYNNDLFGNDASDTSTPAGTNGNISADPAFANRQAGDFHLLTASPCVNTGNDAGVSPGDTDFDGQPRIQSARVDMGAFESPYGLAIQLSTAATYAGNTVSGSVSLSLPAPAGGVNIALSSDSAAATVPTNIFVAAGGQTASFNVTTSSVAVQTNARITATSTVGTDWTILSVLPVVPVSVVISPSTVTGGSPATGVVTLNAPAASSNGIIVNLASSDPSVTFSSATVVVPYGSMTAGFSISTKTLTTQVVATITASTSGGSASATLTVNPALITAFTIRPDILNGGLPATGKITVQDVAPSPDGLAVTVQSSDPHAVVASPIIVPAGQFSATFTITTSAVDRNTVATFTASVSSSVKTATLDLTPAYGDIDRNGVFDVRDVIAALKIAGGLSGSTDVQVTLGDILGEGALDVNDAVALLRTMNGK